MKILYQSCFILTGIFFSQLIQAGTISCESVFSQQSNQLQLTPKDLLDPKNLKENGFSLKKYENGSYYIVDLKDKKEMTLKIINSPYLYEWQERSYHQEWVRNRGVTKNEMDYILSQGGQAAGRGFYVSLNPVDSSAFGDTLTVFKTRSPMVVMTSSDSTLLDTQEGALRLQKAGIDGVSMGDTWLNIINYKQLQSATGLNREIVAFLSQDLETSLNIVMTKYSILESQGFWSYIPKNNLLYKMFQGQEILTEDLIRVGKIVVESGARISPIPNKYFDTLFYRAITNYFNFELYSSDKKVLLDVLMKYNNNKNYINIASVDFFEKTENLIKQKTQQEEDYLTILDTFDIKTLTLLLNKLKLNEELSFEKIKDTSKSIKNTRAQIDFKKIKTFDDLLIASQGLVKGGLRYREDQVVMMTENYSKKQTMVLGIGVGNFLKENPFLTITEVPNSLKLEKMSYEIDYASVFNYKQYSSLLSSGLLRKLNKISSLGRINANSKETKNLNKLLMHELVSVLMKPEMYPELAKIHNFTGKLSALNLYQMFMAIHPFEDGNGRVGRLFYEYLHKSIFKYEMLPLTPPIFDFDLFLNPLQFNDSLKLGGVIRTWVSRASNDQEFLQRCQQALNALAIPMPSIKSMFPEIVPLIGLENSN